MAEDRDRGFVSVGPLLGPQVMEPMPLQAIVPHIARIENRWVFFEREKVHTMRDLVSARREGEICVVIGPEGGIDSLEIGWLEENGFTPCTLGENIFRSETTPLVVLSIMLYENSGK